VVLACCRFSLYEPVEFINTFLKDKLEWNQVTIPACITLLKVITSFWDVNILLYSASPSEMAENRALQAPVSCPRPLEDLDRKRLCCHYLLIPPFMTC